jgi:serine phosphatase RsbU (regulator of sigma subunit)
MGDTATTKAGDTGHGSPTRQRSPEVAARKRRRPLHLPAIVVLVIGFAITATMTVGARALRDDNEDRLLRQRVHEAAAVASAAIPGAVTPLSSAGIVALSTGGDPVAFQRIAGPITTARVPFAGMSLWRIGAGNAAPVATAGIPPEIGTWTPEQRRALLSEVAQMQGMKVVDLLAGRDRRLGYAVASPPANGVRYVAYGEAVLQRERRARIARDTAFSDLDYALYIGTTLDRAHLLASSTGGDVPLRGRTDSESVPFGDTRLTIVLAPHTNLGGTFLNELPWLLAITGSIITLASAALAEWLVRRRRHAEDLADELQEIAAENAQLLADQQTVAYTLQHSLLPEDLPRVEGVELGVRYVAGVEGVDIGGDWYDVIRLDDDRLFFVVGDVSGRGLRAATIMASLRYAIRAYATQGDGPATVLTKLSKLLNVTRDGSFATVLCGIVDPEHRLVRLASAGHPYPLLVADGTSEYVRIHNGVPVGVNGREPYETVTVDLPERGTLLVFTDGLVERRGEGLDVGFERLRASTTDVDGSLEELLTKVVHDVTYEGSEDDTAVLGIRWVLTTARPLIRGGTVRSTR